MSNSSEIAVNVLYNNIKIILYEKSFVKYSDSVKIVG